jgi:hypothetical protein
MKKFSFTLLAVAIGLCMAACTNERAYINDDDSYEIKEADLNLTQYLPAPSTNATPATSFIATKFGGNVMWVPEDHIFQHGEAYMARVTLTPLPGFYFPEGDIKVVYNQKRVLSTETGTVLVDTTITCIFSEINVTNPNARTGLIEFPPTDEVQVNRRISVDPDLTFTVPTPVLDGTPVPGFNASLYRSDITWTYIDESNSNEVKTMNPGEKFRIHTAYTAVVTLRPLQEGDAFKREEIGDDSFIHNGGGIIQLNTVTVDKIELSISFPVSSATAPTMFASRTGVENSAINLIRTVARQGNQSFLEFRIVAYGAVEQVVFTDESDLGTGGLILTEDNSPANVVIDGDGLTVDLGGNPTGAPLITVGKGVTLTLRNITLRGLAKSNNPVDGFVRGNDTNNNTAPVIEVKDGGALILDGGTSIMDNNADKDHVVGGIRLSGTSSSLTMNTGSMIRNVAGGSGAFNPGGVYVGNGCKFTMAGGVIMDNKTRGDGAGVMIHGGLFIMNDGVISGNKVDNVDGDGGGVTLYSEGCQFFMKGGTISNNESRNGGGVYIASGIFSMESGEIRENTAREAGGGVYCEDVCIFNLVNGNIRKNKTDKRGGGVVVGGAIFEMHYGNIEENTVASSDGMGAGVYVGTSAINPAGTRSYGIFTMSGGAIKGNAVWPGESKLPYGGGKGVGVYGESNCRFSMTMLCTIYGLGGFNDLTKVPDWEITELQNYYRYQIHRVSLTYDDYASTPGGREVGYALYYNYRGGGAQRGYWRNRTIKNEEFDTRNSAAAGFWDN